MLASISIGCFFWTQGKKALSPSGISSENILQQSSNTVKRRVKFVHFRDLPRGLHTLDTCQEDYSRCIWKVFYKVHITDFSHYPKVDCYYEMALSEVITLGYILLVDAQNNRLPRWLSGKESVCQCRRCGFDPWVGPWRRNWQPTPVFLPGNSHGQRNLMGCYQWGSQRVGHK